MLKKIFLLTLSVLAASMLGACSSHKFDVSVTPTRELSKTYGFYPTIEVDIAGLSDTDAINFTSYPVDKYFLDSSTMRAYLEPITFKFSQDDLDAKVLEGGSDDFAKIFDKEPAYLVVIANLPYADKEQQKLDPRKFILKLDDSMFSVDHDIYLKIGPTGLIKTTKEDAFKSSPKAEETINQPIIKNLKCEGKEGSKDLNCRELYDNEKKAKK